MPSEKHGSTSRSSFPIGSAIGNSIPRGEREHDEHRNQDIARCARRGLSKT